MMFDSRHPLAVVANRVTRQITVCAKPMRDPSGASLQTMARSSRVSQKESCLDMKRDRHSLLALTALFLIASLWTYASWAQSKISRVGVLVVNPSASAEVQQWFEPFRRTLSEHGWIEGKNVFFEHRDG